MTQNPGIRLQSTIDQGEERFSDPGFDSFGDGRVHVVPVDDLRPARSPRLDGEDVAHSRMLAELDIQLPPIIVHRQTMRIIDGTHRVSAARLRGEGQIGAVFFEGSEYEAFAVAVRENVTHGLPLTFADRLAAATRLVAHYPEWSDRALADIAGLSPATIRGIRRRNPQLCGTGGDKRTGRDGRARPLNGVAGRQRARDIMLAAPEASLRQVARAAGISPTTVKDVRDRMLRGDEPVEVQRSGTRRKGLPESGRSQFDVDSALRNLSHDPSLRFSESGRSALRWLSTHVVRPREWLRVSAELPPHTAFVIAQIARQCAAEWSQLATDLQDRTRQAVGDDN